MLPCVIPYSQWSNNLLSYQLAVRRSIRPTRSAPRDPRPTRSATHAIGVTRSVHDGRVLGGMPDVDDEPHDGDPDAGEQSGAQGRRGDAETLLPRLRRGARRSEEHTSELQSPDTLV